MIVQRSSAIFFLVLAFFLGVWIGNIAGMWMDFLSRTASGAGIAFFIAFLGFIGIMIGSGCALIGFSEMCKGDIVRASRGSILFLMSLSVAGLSFAGGVFIHHPPYVALF